jgi:tetratricopeptide (TPR) repeat protein
LGCIYEDINQQEKERNSFLKAVDVFSAHFPQTLQFAICLGSLADLYESTGKTNEAETQYSRAVAICFAHFPQHLSYAICLYNLGLLLKNAGRKNEAMQRIKEVHKVYTSNGLQLEATACLARLQELRT